MLGLTEPGVNDTVCCANFESVIEPYDDVTLKKIAQSGNDFFAHKTGFTAKSLTRAFEAAGFAHVYLGTVALEIQAFGFAQAPDAAARAVMNLG